MTDFEESIPPARRIFRRRLNASRLAEIGFGWIAKGTMVVVVVAAVILAVLDGGSGLADLPSTRRQWLGVAAVVLFVLAGVVVYHYTFAASPPNQ